MRWSWTRLPPGSPPIPTSTGTPRPICWSTSPHSQLDVHSHARVTVAERRYPDEAMSRPWEQCGPDHWGPLLPEEGIDFVHPSPRIPARDRGPRDLRRACSPPGARSANASRISPGWIHAELHLRLRRDHRHLDARGSPRRPTRGLPGLRACGGRRGAGGRARRPIRLRLPAHRAVLRRCAGHRPGPGR